MRIELVRKQQHGWWTIDILVDEMWNNHWRSSFKSVSRQLTRLTKELNMKTAEAYYIPDPVQIYVYIDEKEIKELPENAVLICKVESSSDLVKAVESYFILGSGS